MSMSAPKPGVELFIKTSGRGVKCITRVQVLFQKVKELEDGEVSVTQIKVLTITKTGGIYFHPRKALDDLREEWYTSGKKIGISKIEAWDKTFHIKKQHFNAPYCLYIGIGSFEYRVFNFESMKPGSAIKDNGFFEVSEETGLVVIHED